MESLPNSGQFKKGLTPWNKGLKLGRQSPELVAKRLAARKTFKQSEQTRRKIGIARKERFARLGYLNTRETRAKIGAAFRGRSLPLETRIKLSGRIGPLSARWVADRTQLKTDRRQAYDTRYREWMFKIKNRDGWKCKIADANCSGRIEAHHILPWRDFPELRYQINNGITLCQHHHPRTRDGEVQMVAAFQKLVAEAQ